MYAMNQMWLVASTPVFWYYLAGAVVGCVLFGLGVLPVRGGK